MGEDVYGKRTFAPPASLACRWEEKAELFMNRFGEEVTSKSKVFLDTSVMLEGYLFLGTSTASSPLEVDGAYEIRGLQQIPDLRNLQTLTVAML